MRGKINKYNSLYRLYEDTLTLIELAMEEGDESLYDECKANVESFKSELEIQTLSTLLTGEYDNNNAIITFHAGAGGTEAQDWALMLYRMYNRWCERHGFKTSTLDYLDGDEAGIKSAVMLVEGQNAYGFLKKRWVFTDLSVFLPLTSGRRYTSFASVEVIPEIDDDINAEIRPEDIKMDVYRQAARRSEG